MILHGTEMTMCGDRKMRAKVTGGSREGKQAEQGSRGS